MASEVNCDQKLEYITNLIKSFPDFPKPGIIFRDIFSALRDGKACVYLKDLLVCHVKKNYPDIDCIAGLDSRGFLFGMMLSAELGVGFLPVRKKGKLPGEILSIEFELEYGVDTFQIEKSSIRSGDKVLLIDDLIATGGSMKAAEQLIKNAGGIVVGAFVIMEVEFLKGRDKLSCELKSMIKYGDD